MACILLHCVTSLKTAARETSILHAARNSSVEVVVVNDDLKKRLDFYRELPRWGWQQVEFNNA